MCAAVNLPSSRVAEPHFETVPADRALSAGSVLGPGIKWSYTCRALDLESLRADPHPDGQAPVPGDLALFRVDELGYHTSITTADQRKLRIYEGDLLVGVFGHRYATDAYEARVQGLDDLSLLTAGGMVGTILSRHREVGRPTRLSFLGYVADAEGLRVNLKVEQRRPVGPTPPTRNLLVVVGTGMNAGKTTTVARLVHALTGRGLRVAACKLTGSVSNRDPDEMRAAGAVTVRDFSDYGFPSTYLATEPELEELAASLLTDTARVHPDVTVMEIADGILERETAMILQDPLFRNHVRGLLLAADSALGALAAVERLTAWGYEVLAVSGAITSAPLYVEEFRGASSVPVASSAGDDEELAAAVLPRLEGLETHGGLD